MASIHNVHSQRSIIGTVEEVIEILKKKDLKAKVVFRSPQFGVYGSNQLYTIDYSTTGFTDAEIPEQYVILGSSSR